LSLVWNPHIGASVAVQSGTLTGNTAGASTYSGTNIVVAGGSNITVEVQSASRLVFHGASGAAAGAGTAWAITGGSITVNTSGGTISLPAYLTTAAPPGAYLTTAAQSDHSHGALSLVNLTGTSSSNGLTLSAAAPGGGAAIMVSAGTTSGNVQTLALLDSNGVSFGLNGSTVTASHNGYTGATTQFLTTMPRLDEIRNPTTDAVFAMNTRQVQFQWGTNFTTFATATNRQGMLEIDIAGNYTGPDKIDVLHIHQSTFDPPLHMIHVEAIGTNQLPLHLLNNGSDGAWMNKPIRFTVGTHTDFTVGTVPMVLGTEMSNSVANLNANYLQGKVSSEFQSTGAYLTTAALSNHSHAFATTSTTGASIVVGTTNSAGATIGVPAYLTTAQPVGAYLTTARASNDAVGLNTALTANGVSWTVNSSGLSLNVPAFLTTGQPPGAYLTTARASTDAIGLNSALTANGVSMTANSSGLSLNFPAFLTTAAQSGHTHGAGPTLTGPIAATSASNGLSLNVNAIGNTTAQTNVTWTVGTNGLSLNAAGYAGTGTSATNATFTLNSAGLALSVAAPGAGGGVAVAGSGASTVTSGTLQFANLNGVSFGLNGSTMTASYSSNHSHGNPTLALTNLTGTTASASNGFTLSLSAAAPGGGAAATASYYDPIGYITGSAYSSHPPATTYFMPFQLDAPQAFSYLNVVKSFGVGVPAGTSSNVSQTFRLSYRHAFTIFSRQNYGAQSSNLTTVASGSWGASISFQHSSSNSQSLDLRWVTDSTGGTAQTATNSAGNGWSARVQGPRLVRIPFVTTLTAGEYWIAHGHSTTAASTGNTATTAMLVSNFHVAPQLLNSNLMMMGAGTTSSSVGHLWPAAQGVASAVTTNNSMALSVISNLTVNHWYWNGAAF
jgi:hypothetical protein